MAVPKRRAFEALAVAFIACNDTSGPGGDAFPDTDTLSLDVRVHLLLSESERVAATLSETEVAALFAGVNSIWRQAAIEWQIESIVQEAAPNAADYELALDNRISATDAVLASVIPVANLLAGGWDVFIIRDLGDIAGGVYLSDTGAILFAETGPTGPQARNADGERILAHEFGHSLGLQHVPCTPTGNLMSPGCPANDRTRLEPAQVSLARRVALSGGPFGL